MPRTRNGSESRLTVSSWQRSISSVILASGSEPMGSNLLSVSTLTLPALITHSSKLEDLIVLQHPRAVLSGVLLDLLHRQLDLSRFQMGDVDFGAALQLGELFCEQARAQVLRYDRQLPFAVAKRGLDDEVLEIGYLVDCRPKRVVRRGVAGEYQA